MGVERGMGNVEFLCTTHNVEHGLIFTSLTVVVPVKILDGGWGGRGSWKKRYCFATNLIGVAQDKIG